MTTFAELREQSEFLKLNAQRDAIISCLETLKDGCTALPSDKPSLRSFNKLEKAIEEESANLQSINKKIAIWFSSKGGDRKDSDFVQYKHDSVEILSALETVQNAYYDLLVNADLIPKQPKAEISADLKDILQSLSETQKSAVEAQKQAISAQTASNKSHKRKELECPRFDPSHCRNDPLAFKSFWLKFEQFVRDCDSDSDKLF